jgi:hypothetical protein
MWDMNHITATQIKGSKIYPSLNYTIQRWNTKEFMAILVQA